MRVLPLGVLLVDVGRGLLLQRMPTLGHTVPIGAQHKIKKARVRVPVATADSSGRLAAPPAMPRTYARMTSFMTVG
jgi:hypothetical protein